MKKTGNIFLILSFLYSACILALGSWWLYLIVKYGEKVASITGDDGGNKVLKMVKWEGGTFFTLLVLLSMSLLFLYFKDQKKTKGLQAFFASMTHELKTPLASIKLQAEVISEDLEGKGETKTLTLVNRLLQDTQKMETQMDKILQLSRLEGGGTFHLSKINLENAWSSAVKQYGNNLEVKGSIPTQTMILGDELALSLIFRNLFENTKNHSPENSCQINLTEDSQTYQLEYQDKGKFEGDSQKLGTLFYKHNSKKGSGIGLYLISRLMETMKGSMKISTNPNMSFTLTFSKGNAHGH